MNPKTVKPTVSLKVRHGKGFDCRCRVCNTEGRIRWDKRPDGAWATVVFCPKCKDNYVVL